VQPADNASIAPGHDRPSVCRPVRPPRSLRTLLVTTMLAGLVPLPAHAAAELLGGRIKLTADFMEGIQFLEADGGAFEPENTDTSNGFQRMRFSLGLTFDFTEHISGFVELSDEPNDFGGDPVPFEIAQDLGFVDVHVLGMADDALGTNYSDNHDVFVRIGNTVTTVFNFRGYSDGAVVQANPLIGNSPADMVTAENGAQLFGRHKLAGVPVIDGVNWDIGVSVPTFFEDFGTDRGFNYFGRVSVDTGFGLSIGGGGFFNDMGDQVDERPFGDVQTAEILFGDGENYNFPGSAASARDTHSGLLPGLSASILHADFEYNAPVWPLTARGWAGYAEDDFSFVDGGGNRTVRSQATGFVKEESEEFFFAGEVTFYLIPDTFYAAGRYTRVVNVSDNVDDDNDAMERFQIGGGFWFAEGALIKGEYVRQNEEDQSPGQIGDSWDGGMIEVSFSF